MATLRSGGLANRRPPTPERPQKRQQLFPLFRLQTQAKRIGPHGVPDIDKSGLTTALPDLSVAAASQRPTGEARTPALHSALTPAAEASLGLVS